MFTKGLPTRFGSPFFIFPLFPIVNTCEILPFTQLNQVSMNHSNPLYLILFSLLFGLVSSSADAQSSDRVRGEIIVMFHAEAEAHDLLRNPKIREVIPELVYLRSLEPLSNIHLFGYDPKSTSDREALRTLRGLSTVRAAQWNHLVQERALPNDPSIGSQWHHANAADHDIDSDLAWDITTGGTTAAGDEIVVCVIEGGGSNYNHVDLIDNHWVNANEIPNNGIDDDQNGFVDDYNGWDPVSQTDNISAGGHGTAVSGMIGATGNNGQGGAGVNWDVKIMQVEVGSLNEANVIAAYAYPRQMRHLYNTSGGQNGAFVVATNASWGIDYADPSNYPVWCAYYDDLGQAGILNCGATANNNVNIDAVGDMPTACGSDYMVSVTATNNSDQRTFSAYGATTIDLAAPGGGVYLPSGSSKYSSTSGTSFASPCVAGAIALVYSAPCFDLATLSITSPQAAADLVRSYILDGVDPVGSLSGLTVTGGRLNVKNALDLAMANCGPPPLCTADSIAATSECYYSPISQSVEPRIVVSAWLGNSGCHADTLCYSTSTSEVVCIPLSEGELNNDVDYALTDVQTGVEYTLWYVTSEGPSDNISVVATDCSLEIAGCTDPDAANYNPGATIDDGSCDFPCTEVTLTIDTDCWGNEVSWEIRDADGVAIATVSTGTYDDEQTYTWSDCLDDGCYTFTIFDSFGDGLNGGSYSFCDTYGNYTITANGEVVVAMDDPDYGSSATHTFCVDSDVPPCQQPYPQVEGLSSSIEPNGVQLSWTPIPGSIACQVQGSKVSGGGTVTMSVNLPEASQKFVPQGQLQSGEEYQWRVRCGCSRSPVIAGPWSEWSFFNWPAARDRMNPSAVSAPGTMGVKLYPNPASRSATIDFNADSEGVSTIALLTVTGKVLRTWQHASTSGNNSVELTFGEVPQGIYLLKISGTRETQYVRLAIQR